MIIGVIGGGASGLMAAVTAADCSDNKVIIFERQSRMGRKLLATGNGRCNLSNRKLGVENYHGENNKFILPALGKFGVEDTLEYFNSLGLMTVTEQSGRVYPLSDQANSVLDVMRFAAEAEGVEIRTGCEIKAISKSGAGFILRSDDGEEYADKIIITAGGAAGGKLGGGSWGYELLKSLGHTCTKLYPSLVQLKTDNRFVRSLKGVRAEGDIKLIDGEKILTKNSGEIQFTEYGISGPAVFEISRIASVSRKNIKASIDFMRELSVKEIVSLLLTRQGVMPQLTLENLLTGMVHNRLGRVIVRCAGFELDESLLRLSYSDMVKIAKMLKSFELDIIGTMGMDNAQITAGGIKTDEFYPDTLESRLCPGVYAAGEVLDIDGDCGGFNLQWAWSSGRLAGQLKFQEDLL